MVARTCQEAGFPYCERVYVGSYFCENYFLSLSDGFFDSLQEFCLHYDLASTLVIPIFGQAFIKRGQARALDVLDRYCELFDEVIVNDVASFFDLEAWLSNRADAAGVASNVFANHERLPKLGLGRLFCKEARDARYASMLDSMTRPGLSEEAAACLTEQQRRHPNTRPLVEIDPMSAIVDVSEIIASSERAAAFAQSSGQKPQIEIAIHLPFCYATTGRNCGPASVNEPDSSKFRLGRGCSNHCLRLSQGCLTDEGARYIKHGRTYYFENPGCQIAGTDSWRIVYSALEGVE